MTEFKPMLAFSKMPDLTKLRWPVVASPKLDGIRCVTGWGGKVLSRTLKPIPNKSIREAFGGMSLDGLDGELIVPGTTFQETTARVMGRDAVGPWEYHVFDCHAAEGGFTDRFACAKTMVESTYFEDNVKLVPHTLIRDENELALYERAQLDKGYEGVMLRDPRGPYKYGRSTEREGWLLKLKRFEDAEATIVGFEEEMENTNEAYKDEVGRTKRSSAKAGKVGKGRLGAFLLERADGCRFTCGGFTDAQKAEFWARRAELQGALAKFKFQAHGSKDAPRSPVFLGIRAPGDM